MSETSHDPGPDAATGWRPAGGRLLVIAGLTALAVAQPVLDLLGGSPATFRFHGFEGADIVWFGLAVVVLPPLTLWAMSEVAIAARRQVGWVVHLAVVAALSGLFGILAAKEVIDLAAGHVGAGLAAAAGSVAAYRRFEPFGTWTRVLSIANPVFLALFVFFSPVSDSISRDTQEPLEVEFEADESPANVVMVVFDEWSTQSILADDLTVDAVRLPNLAAFAEESTWYRRFTTVSSFTPTAVPALLDGLDPYGEPTWNDHPDSLFSLLGGSHHLIVSESVTDMCGLEGCSLRPTAPPPAADRVDEAVAPPPSGDDTGPRWRRLVDDTVDIWRERVTPGAGESAQAFDDFEEDISPVDSPPPPEAPPDPTADFDEDDILLERFLNTQLVSQPDRHVRFVDALQPTDVPFFAYQHLILPHQPWERREDGTPYDVIAARDNYELDNDHPWPIRVSHQRYLLQAEYTDRLLGEILAKLTEIGAYDDTLIIVVADHGVSFDPGESSRLATASNVDEIAYVPLFVKAPGQRSGRIDDTNVNSTDLVPTVADLLGIELPWDTDGYPAGAPEITARGGDKYLHSFSADYDQEFLGVIEWDDATIWTEVVAGRFGSVAAGEDRIAALYRDRPGSDVLGRSPDEVFGPVAGTATVDELDRLTQPDSGAPLLGEITGRLDDTPEDATTVVVAVDERIVGVSPLYRRGDDEDSFVVLLPGDALDADVNTIRIGIGRDAGTISELELR